MKISLVTISYNQGEYLERAIQSIVKQRQDVDLEYIVVDPGSTDNSREIIAKYENDIDHVVLEPDEGPADGLNKGFANATGDIYGYLNADDELDLGVLKEVIEYFSKHPEVDVVSAHGEIIDENDNIIQKCFSHKFNLQRYAEGNCVLVQQSTFFRGDIYKVINGFNKNNRISWDGELMVDMALNDAKFARLHRFWSRFRVYDQSISGSGAFLEKAAIEHERISQKIGCISISNTSRKIYWLLSRIGDPVLLLLRLFDGLKNGRRVISS